MPSCGGAHARLLSSTEVAHRTDRIKRDESAFGATCLSRGERQAAADHINRLHDKGHALAIQPVWHRPSVSEVATASRDVTVGAAQPEGKRPVYDVGELRERNQDEEVEHHDQVE